MLGSESAKLHPGMGGNERRTKKKNTTVETERKGHRKSIGKWCGWEMDGGDDG